jgi:hypothetical protein
MPVTPNKPLAEQPPDGMTTAERRTTVPKLQKGDKQHQLPHRTATALDKVLPLCGAVHPLTDGDSHPEIKHTRTNTVPNQHHHPGSRSHFSTPQAHTIARIHTKLADDMMRSSSRLQATQLTLQKPERGPCGPATPVLPPSAVPN